VTDPPPGPGRFLAADPLWLLARSPPPADLAGGGDRAAYAGRTRAADGSPARVVLAFTARDWAAAYADRRRARGLDLQPVTARGPAALRLLFQGFEVCGHTHVGFDVGRPDAAGFRLRDVITAIEAGGGG
jgi:hypothetical protein